MSDEHVFSSKYPDLELPTGNFITNVFKNIKKFEQLPALVCAKTLKEVSYKELKELSYKCCGYFTSKLAKGTRIAFIGPNSLEYCIGLIGAMAAGMVVLGIFKDSKEGEIISKLEDCDIHHIIFDDSVEEKLEPILEKMGQQFTKIRIGPKRSSDTVRNIDSLNDILTDPTIKPTPEVQIEGEESICILFTSGTTGPGKPLTLSHRAWNTNLAMVTQPQWNPEPEATGDYQPILCCNRAMVHVYGIFCIFYWSLSLGHKLIVSQYSADTLVDELDKFKVTKLHIVPWMINLLLKIPIERPSILEHLKVVFTGGAPLPPSLEKELLGKLRGISLQNSYALSETGGIALDPVGPKVPRILGTIINNVQVKVLDPVTGKSLPANTTGELVVRSPSIFTEYIGHPTATAEMKLADGWLATGDIGQVDNDCNIILLDRKKEMIKSLSNCPYLTIFPAEIENVLSEHPGVDHVCVVPCPHAELLEAPRAYVVLSDKSVTKEELMDLVAQNLSVAHQLKGGVVFMDELPKTPMGKVAKNELKQLARTS